MTNSNHRPAVRGRVIAALGAVVLCLGLAVSATPGGQEATAATIPPPTSVVFPGPETVTVNVTKGLGPLQVVQVRWENFQPQNTIIRPKPQPPITGDNSLLLTQCQADGEVSTAHCTPTGGYAIGKIAPDVGKGAASLQLLGRYPELGTPAMLCDVSNPCEIRAYLLKYGVPFDPATATKVVVPIQFRATPDNCPTDLPRSRQLNGTSGAAGWWTNLSWGGRLCTADPALGLRVTATNSPTTRSQFAQGKNDFGLIAGPYLPDETPPEFEWAPAPVNASALVVAYNLVNCSSSSRFSRLRLTTDMVAHLFLYDNASSLANQYTLPDLVDLNGVDSSAYSSNMKTYLRGDISDDTLLFTSWLKAKADAVYSASSVAQGADPVGQPTALFNNLPARDYFIVRLPGAGYDDLGRRMRALGATCDAGAGGGLGLFDSSAAEYYGFQTAEIDNGAAEADCPEAQRGYVRRNGQTTPQTYAGCFVAPTPDSVARGLADLVQSPADPRFLVHDFTKKPDPLAYPLAKLTYLVGQRDRTELDGRDVSGLVKEAITYAVGPGQVPDDGVLPVGYTPLPAPLVQQALDAATFIDTPITTTTSSTSSTTSTTTPTTSSSTTTSTTRPSVIPPVTRPIVTVPRPTTTASTTTSVEETTTTVESSSTTAVVAPTTAPPTTFEVMRGPSLQGSSSGVLPTSLFLLGLGGLVGGLVLEARQRSRRAAA